jgi:hypothetical protein
MQIVLISCVNDKNDGPAAARDLYSSTLFIEMRRYAEKFSDAWYILSAKHGLLAPDDVIAKYDLTLNSMAVSDRRAWAQRVGSQLNAVLPKSAEVSILAGEKYFEFLVPFLESHGHAVSLPLRGVRLFDRVPRLRQLIDGGP